MRIIGTLLLVLGIFMASCIDRIDFDVPAGLSDSIVIQARVVKGDMSFVEIAASRLFDFSPESRQPVSLRQAILYDDNNVEMVLDTRTPGYYKVDLDDSTPIKAEVGKGYRIRIETFDNRIYESTLDILHPNNAPDALHISKTKVLARDGLDQFVETDQIRLSLDTEIDNTSDGGLYWEVNNVYRVTDSPVTPAGEDEILPKTCYISKTVDVNEIYVLDPGDLVGGAVEDYSLLQSFIDFRFAEGLYYEVKQYSLSSGAFSYWNAINILSEREGNMFDGPVGEISTNLANINDAEDEIFGYFFATSEEIIRKRVDQELIGEFTTLCPPRHMCNGIPGEGCTCGLCCDCLIDPDAVLMQPDYWID